MYEGDVITSGVPCMLGFSSHCILEAGPKARNFVQINEVREEDLDSLAEDSNKDSDAALVENLEERPIQTLPGDLLAVSLVRCALIVEA